MAGVKIKIDEDTKKYWKAQLALFRQYVQKSSCRIEKEPDEIMPYAKRKLLTRDYKSKGGGLLKNDPTTAEHLIEQAVLTLNAQGFDRDETALLRGWLKKGAPKGKPGTAPVPVLDRLAIHYFYACMIGMENSDINAVTDILRPEFPDDTPAHVKAASQLPMREMADDKLHRLNAREAKKMLREIFEIKQNALGGVLNKKPKKTEK
jgi:hypothetical protein